MKNIGNIGIFDIDTIGMLEKHSISAEDFDLLESIDVYGNSMARMGLWVWFLFKMVNQDRFLHATPMRRLVVVSADLFDQRRGVIYGQVDQSVVVGVLPLAVSREAAIGTSSMGVRYSRNRRRCLAANRSNGCLCRFRQPRLHLSECPNRSTPVAAPASWISTTRVLLPGTCTSV